MRPLGLLMVWHIDKDTESYTIRKTGLFGYYQNGVDYLNEYVRINGWQWAESASSQVIAYEKGEYRIELSLVEATGVDLSKELYLENLNVEETKT